MAFLSAPGCVFSVLGVFFFAVFVLVDRPPAPHVQVSSCRTTRGNVPPAASPVEIESQ